VADFGIGRAPSATTGSRTKTGTVMGTAGYMSPEQALGEPAIPKSDLYSLGIVLCEAVTGRLPFTAENPIAVSMKHVNEPPRPPQRLNPDVPSGMNATILKLLAKDPADRHADADELAEDLWRARRGMPPAAAAVQEGAKAVQAPLPRGPAPTAPQAAGTRPRKRRSPAPLLLGLLLLLLGLFGLGWALGRTLGPLGGPDLRSPPSRGAPEGAGTG
jgi:eukaryotic-like serine/threonine-protein kinase